MFTTTVFVFGTLRRSGWFFNAERTHARMRGAMYVHPQGAFPVVVPHSDRSEHWVHGDLIDVDDRDPEWFDCLTMELGAGYNATWQQVVTDDGQWHRALVFTWPPDQERRARIDSGDWLAHEGRFR